MSNHQKKKKALILSLTYDLGFFSITLNASLQKQTSVLAPANRVLKEVLEFANHQNKTVEQFRCVSMRNKPARPPFLQSGNLFEQFK